MKKNEKENKAKTKVLDGREIIRYHKWILDINQAKKEDCLYNNPLGVKCIGTGKPVKFTDNYKKHPKINNDPTIEYKCQRCGRKFYIDPVGEDLRRLIVEER